jgi:hypothetical protein
MRVKQRCILIGASYYCALMLVLAALNGGIATASPRWEKTNAAGLEQGVAIAVCLPADEVICVGIGCRDPDGFDFVEMIVGDWLQGPTLLSAGAHNATSVMSADERASRALNLPVSRGPVDRAFLLRLVGQRTLQIEALWSGYAARFPLAGFGRGRRMLLHICARRHIA